LLWPVSQQRGWCKACFEERRQREQAEQLEELLKPVKPPQKL
jgi:hypothetical protein